MHSANTVVVLDFETTGLSPDWGDCAIEIGAVRIKEGVVVERFQELMNPGFRISGFIEGFTGITNEMLRDAAPCGEVMHRFADFIEDDNLVAHNAGFDKRFLDAELGKISRTYSGEFACSMLLSRRIFQNAPNHKLGSLVEAMNISSDGQFHRALYDSEMTAKLWLAMLNDICERYVLHDIPFSLIQRLVKTSKKSVDKVLKTW
ncbi:MAG: 3'-5' exonuclease [Verrucomicrobia bacterium]|nr:3'-5' exonuclease [Verrucomicrobiota bacterium]MDA1068298.1 3'-5' exonuclease [Verrucomicrobiota bacterium]